MKKIKEFFSQSKVENEKLLVNLTKDRWVTDNEIERLFSILNKQCDEVMCVVCTPDKYVNDFLKSIKNLNQYSLLMESDKEIIGHS